MENVELVRRYYAAVDGGRIDELLDLFATDAVYCRPGYPPMVGRSALAAFYRGDRRIESGAHQLRHVTADAGSVAVHGDFVGSLKGGLQVTLRFADFFVMSADGLFSRRDTFFFVPLV